MADERWRIDADNSRKYRVVLHLHGVDHCMSVAQAMALVGSAPRLAGPWTPPHGSPAGCGAMRSDAHGKCVAVVFGEQWPLGTHEWAAYEPTTRGRSETWQEAQDAADAALRAAGWVLDDAPTRGVRG